MSSLYSKKGLPKAVAIVGPTASGKTDFSLALAERFSGEIIGCDSMQIYRGMDIGTAKPTPAERARVPHHLIDFVSPGVPYSAADYAEAAGRAVEEIASRGALPVFCGGTGLYLEAARSGRHEGLPPVSEELRSELIAEAEALGAEEMHRRLAACDPASAAAIHKNNLRRVLRALEIYRTTGVPKSRLDEESRSRKERLSLLVFGLFPENRELLHRRIDRRVDAMMEAGLGDEVRALFEMGAFSEGSTAKEAIGYKEYVSYLRGEISEAEAVLAIKTATHRYARRQLTWFRAVPGIRPLACGEAGVTEEARATAFRLTEEFLLS